MPRITANGIQIYYELHGPEQAGVVVLSNGVLMTTSSWAFQRRPLSRRHRLLLYDCRGQGQSDHPPGPYSLELHADDLAALLDALGVERAHIGGTSYGAEVGLAFALKYPQRTRSLIVTSACSQVDPLLRSIAEAWLAATRAHDPDRLWQEVYPLTFSEPWIALNRQALETARERYRELDFDAMTEMLLAFLAMDLTPQLHRIAAPTLVVTGDEDLLKPRRYSERIVAEIPDVEFAIIPHAAHAALWEQPDLFNTLLLGFLEKQTQDA
jgi:3-oxoadipate enol-lactonase